MSIQLQEPKKSGSVSLEETLWKRRSKRHYNGGQLSIDNISQLLWAAYGANIHHKTVPSAGGVYSMMIYVSISNVLGMVPGLYKYDSGHFLNLIKEGDIRVELSMACLGQKPIMDAAINIIITADYTRMVEKYGKRGYRYLTLEAGHIGQNIHLQAESLGLGTVMIGAFKDAAVKNVLEITEEPLYVIPVGKC